MIATFGNNIKSAFTSGQEVKAIYSNGVKVWPTRVLPAGFTGVDFIRSTEEDPSSTSDPLKRAGILLDSNFVISSDTVIEAEITAKRGYIGTYYVFSIDTSSESIANVRYNNQTSVAYFLGQGDKGNISNINYVNNTDYKIVWTPSKIIINDTVLNGVIPKSGTGKFAILNEFLPKYKFMYIWGSRCCLKSFKVSKGDSLIYDLVPAKRDSDGELGMYDFVTETFFIKHSSSQTNFYDR